MKKISLTQGKFALVDNEDYDDLIQFKWCAARMGNTFYAIRSTYINKKQIIELMHRRILGLKYRDGKHTDHINHNGINNRKSNLRICTNKENMRNRKIKQCNNISGFKGVCWSKLHKKWHAQITVNSQVKHLGFFNSKIDAAKAYNKAAIKYFGKFANLNIIKE